MKDGFIVEKYDLIVVGGGTGGSIAGKTAAELGYKVCIIDRKIKSKIGSKVCGEAVGKHHFDNVGISRPKGDELNSLVTGIDIFSPDMKTVFRIKEKGLTGFMINRLEFGQRLLTEALDAGVELLDQRLVLDPIFKNDFTVGVKVKDLVKNNQSEVFGETVIDASGMAAVLRRKMPTGWQIERKIDHDDIAACYRESREVSHQIDDPEYLKIYLSRKIAPGGYYWIFPKKNNEVNVGLGVQMVQNFPNPRKRLYKHVLSQPLFQNSKKIEGGAGLVSIRRPINLVGNGILFVGDSACQTNPAHGSGIGPSMSAGKLAAQVACRAMDTGDVSRSNLWFYNTKYMLKYGIRYAGLEVFKILLQKCKDEDLNYGMENKLISGKQIFSRTTLSEDLAKNKDLWLKGKESDPFMKSLIQTSEHMKRLREIYEEFPQPEEYSAWSSKVCDVIDEMKGMNHLNPYSIITSFFRIQ